MVINDVVGGRVYHTWDIFREFLGCVRSSYIKN